MSDLAFPKNILGQNGLSVLREVGHSRLSRDFYLAGGTGLALQIKHRRSLDLDFFQNKLDEKISFNTIADDLERIFKPYLPKLLFKQVDQASWIINGVNVTFIAYPFAAVYKPVRGETVDKSLTGIMLASPQEIALMKAYSIGRRATVRDYLDLYFLLSRGITSIKEIIQKAPAKFKAGNEPLFSPRLFLEQLVYTDDLEDRNIPVETLPESKTKIAEIEDYLIAAVQEYLESKNMSGGDF
ncbi:nucleotidyl transferase AbiEii/AbiGii toxin family protein [Pelotomaculum propionicicum]|uniref:Nucleotidyl transferase AbiEii/AbiGii toxin family protein n=1 Tax=Pelotomaculum propionicicum TaxID=258475 RepID=A0A4Y7RK27_9FIRM|nr:nucleotidyl transferase AbiEii/AbiGii toxin family protein [Pelotomaculum propionicicum]TEB09100.1 hypothetical protein Pmgp_03382 [Pelotomaculum propionicicum]